MQKIKLIIENNKLQTLSGICASQTTKKQTPTSSSSHNGENNHKRIDNLFLEFAAFYGQIWRKNCIQDEFLAYMIRQWREALMPFDDRVVEMASEYCRNHQELPPTLPKFIDICRGIRNRNNFIKAVPTTHIQKTAVASLNLAQMKKMLTQ